MNDQRPFRVIVADDEDRDLAQIADYLESLPRLHKWVQKPVRRLLAKPDASSVMTEIRDRYDETDIVLADLYMPTPETGGLNIVKEMAALRKARGFGPQLVIISSKADAERQVDAYRREFRDWFRFVLKPAPLASEPKQYHSEEVWAVALEFAIYDMWRTMRSEPPEGDYLVCAPHGKMAQEVLPWVDKLARTDCPILLIGESGVGKSLLARRIHAGSVRAAGPFHRVHCAEIPETPLESILFGHTKGAFPGAIQRRRGLLETASAGTIFLIDLTQLPSVQQAKLLSALEQHTFLRFGSSSPTPTNARLICTATPDIDKAIARGDVRADLCRAIGKGKVFIPALHERAEDIPLLTEYFLRLRCKARTLCPDRFDAEAGARLIAYSWPGNVQELQSVVFRAAIRAKGSLIAASDLDQELLAETGLPLEVFGRERAKRFREFDDEQLRRALEACKDSDGTFNKARTANALGVPLNALVAELERRQIRLGAHEALRPEFYIGAPATGSPVGQEARDMCVQFGLSSVTVNGQNFARSEPLNVLEYFLWKNEDVRWVEGHLIFPRWLIKGVKNGQELFRQKMTKCSKALMEKHSLAVRFEGNLKDKSDRWKLVAPRITTNITEAKEHYQKSRKLFEEWEALAGGPQPLLANETLASAKTELLEALNIYPNHLESHVLLARCYENLQVGDVSPQEIESTIQSSWEYLSDRHTTVERLRKLADAKQEAPLRALVEYVNRHSALSQVERCEQVLRKWFLPALAERDPALAELRDLLGQLGATNDETTLRNLVKRLLHLPYVLEVIQESAVLMEAVSGFMTDSGKPDVSRIQALSKLRFNTIEEFQSYLRTTLRGIGKGHRAEDSPRQGPELPASIRRKIEQLNRVQQDLQNELRQKPSEHELEEALKARMKWGPDDLKEMMPYRRRPKGKPRAKPPKGM
ncbi:MAG: sigma 54-interacting transcriptional regulator [Planctomycetota bacterium]|nr:sigma 54-interacting transcriptional regulator [Planctomycetota bacterium]